MINTIVRVVTATILIVLLSLLPTPALAQANTTTTVTRISAAANPPADLLPAIAACVGEQVVFSGTLNVVTHTTFNASGGIDVTTMLATQGVSATGQTTGTIYRNQGVGNFVFNTSAPPPLEFPMEFTFVFNFSLIGPGQTHSFVLQQRLHTITNANGATTVSIDTTSVVCR